MTSTFNIATQCKFRDLVLEVPTVQYWYGSRYFVLYTVSCSGGAVNRWCTLQCIGSSLVSTRTVRYESVYSIYSERRPRFTGFTRVPSHKKFKFKILSFAVQKVPPTDPNKKRWICST
jgi:hypothetical protein